MESFSLTRAKTRRLDILRSGHKVVHNREDIYLPPINQVESGVRISAGERRLTVYLERACSTFKLKRSFSSLDSWINVRSFARTSFTEP